MSYKNNLRHYRLKRKLTQQTVYEALGHTSASRLSDWESGGSNPSITHLLTLAQLYAVPVEKLFGKLNRTVTDAVKKRSRKQRGIAAEETQMPVSSADMTVEQQLDVLAKIIVDAYAAQKRQNFPHMGSPERN